MAHARLGVSEIVRQTLLDRTRNVGAQGSGPRSITADVRRVGRQSMHRSYSLTFLRPAGLHTGCTLAVSPGVRCQVDAHHIIWPTDWQGFGSPVESLQV